MNYLLCKIFGHKWYKGYWNLYPWWKCSRCKKLGNQITGKPKKRLR
ncbi:hypothetical protein HYI36_05165 [Bacillus sp. Gen3]|nr:hypothetical protein [Bacillus sp. Gen3]